MEAKENRKLIYNKYYKNKGNVRQKVRRVCKKLQISTREGVPLFISTDEQLNEYAHDILIKNGIHIEKEKSVKYILGFFKPLGGISADIYKKTDTENPLMTGKNILDIHL